MIFQQRKILCVMDKLEYMRNKVGILIESNFYESEIEYYSKCFINLKEYAAIIIPAGMVADRLRYTDDVNKLSPTCEFLKKCFADKQIIKGIICHGIAKLMGIDYVDEDVVVDGDLVSARTGGEHVQFAQLISIDPNFFDSIQKVHVNPKEVCDRCKELLAGEAWNHPFVSGTSV